MKRRFSQRVVLFMGAGFTKEAGLPIMSEFGGESTKQLLSLKRPRNRRDSTPYLIKAGDIFVKFQKYCEKAKSFVDLNINNMEELFCIAEAINEAKVNDLNLDGEKILVKDLLLQIKIWLWKIYHQCPPLNPEKNITEETIGVYDSFFDFLKDSKLSDSLTVLTTNYDLIFEYFAWKRAIPCIYPFKKDDVTPLDVFDREKSDYYISFDPNDRGPIICKLHGSINFFNLKEEDKSSFGISYDITKRGEPKVPDPPRPAIFMLNAIWKLRQKLRRRNGEIDLAIIPPTYAKLQEYFWLQTIWNSSFRALENATHIIFIGYSIPESDGFIRAMINGAMATRKDKKGLRVFVVDPDKENIVFNRYKKIFPRLATSPECFVRLKFCEAWKKGELLKILSAITT